MATSWIFDSNFLLIRALDSKLALIGAQVPNGINGVSFQSLLRGSKFRSKRAYLYWEFHERGFDQALRQGKWKVVRRGRNGSRLELYDLQADPSESYDLAVQFPKIAAEMEALLSKARVPSADYPVKTD